MEITFIDEPYEWKEEDYNLEQPSVIDYDIYHSSITYKQNPVFIKTPFVKSHHGIQRNNHSPSSKYKYYIILDLNPSSTFYKWLEHLETFVQTHIEPKWFDMSLEDISSITQTFMTPFIDKSKSCIRCFIENKHLLIYDQYENNLNFNQTKNSLLQCILQFNGIVYTNTSFYIDVEIKQILVKTQDNLFRRPLLLKQKETCILDDIIDLNKPQEYENELKEKFKEIQKKYNETKQEINYKLKEYEETKYHLNNVLEPKLSSLQDSLKSLEQEQQQMLSKYPHFFSMV